MSVWLQYNWTAIMDQKPAISVQMEGGYTTYSILTTFPVNHALCREMNCCELRSVNQSGQLIFGLKSTKFSNLEFRISDILHWTKVANWTSMTNCSPEIQPLTFPGPSVGPKWPTESYILVAKRSKWQCWTKVANQFLDISNSEIQNAPLDQSGQPEFWISVV